MTEERRQVHRRSPITVVLDDGREFLAHPLPWMFRNDLGNEIMKQNTEAVNEAVRLYTTDVNDISVPQLEVRMSQKITNWREVLKIAYRNYPDESWDLEIDECVGLTLAALEINGLEHLKNLVDPNSPTPMTPSGIDSVTLLSGVTDGLKTPSSVGSSSPDSVEPPSSTSPITSLFPS